MHLVEKSQIPGLRHVVVLLDVLDIYIYLVASLPKKARQSCNKFQRREKSRMHLPTFTTALAFASSALGSPNYGLSARQASNLNAAMKARGRSYIGTSLTIRNDNNEQNIIKSEFGSITPENAMKWDATEPNQNQFSLSGGDQIANWATQNNKQMRCHTLVWYSQLPGWVNNINNNATLLNVMENHIKTLVTRWKGKCTHWDVVNEGRPHEISRHRGWG